MLIQGGKSNDGNVTGLDLSTVRASNGTAMYSVTNGVKTDYIAEPTQKDGGILLASGNYANPVSSSSSTYVSDDAPPESYQRSGQRWWVPSEGLAYIWYEDGDSGQWVQENSATAPMPSHNDTLDRNAVGAHDDIYVRTMTLAEAIAEDAPVGTRYILTDLDNARYDVVASGDSGGWYQTGLASGGKLKLIADNLPIAKMSSQLGTADADLFEYCLRESYATSKEIQMDGVTEIFIEKDIDLTDITTTGKVVITSSELTKGRDAETAGKPIIRFNDDGTSVGRIGINMPKVRPIAKGVEFRTLITDARGVTGDFIAIRGMGVNSAINNCVIKGFAEFFRQLDVGYAFYGGNLYKRNKTVYKHTLFVWAFSTTFRDVGSVGVENTTVYYHKDVFHSVYRDGIYEYNNIVLEDIPSGNCLDNCYFENNITAAVSSTFAADVVTINLYQKNKAGGDKIQISTDTAIHGFDRISRTEVEGTYVSTKEFKTFTRSGADSDILTSAYGAGDGLQLVNSTKTSSRGYVLGIKGGTNSRQARTTYAMQLFGDTIHALPTGWTFTKISDGVYDFVFDANIGLPLFQVCCIPKSISTANVATYQITMKESSGGNWSSFATASGFRLTTRIDGVESTSCHTSITITV